MPAKNREERLQIMLTEDELEALDDFRFRHRMPSRAAAVRHILKQGLASNGTPSASMGERSTDFGVLDTRSNGRRKSA
jgi:metal-responsive CopG/Arc/MetJ family transcriptional regulator